MNNSSRTVLAHTTADLQNKFRMRRQAVMLQEILEANRKVREGLAKVVPSLRDKVVVSNLINFPL